MPAPRPHPSPSSASLPISRPPLVINHPPRAICSRGVLVLIPSLAVSSFVQFRPFRLRCPFRLRRPYHPFLLFVSVAAVYGRPSQSPIPAALPQSRIARCHRALLSPPSPPSPSVPVAAIFGRLSSHSPRQFHPSLVPSVAHFPPCRYHPTKNLEKNLHPSKIPPTFAPSK